MADEPKCSSCGGVRAQDGLCPKCFLVAGLGTNEPVSPAGTATLAPDALPGYQLIERLGGGGMGVVYRARHLRLDRDVAVKVLSTHLRELPGFAARFEREARTMARLVHPGIVTIHDFGDAGGCSFLVMELVEGATLRQLLRDGGCTPALVLDIIRQVCDALAYAHEMGIVHRDIKPENILVDQRGRVKIADFGLARLVAADDGPRLTGSHHVMGTPHYMAPEQIKSPNDVDRRADLYSLGVVFYELLTGELPLGNFTPPSQAGHGTPRIDEVVNRALAQNREARYQTAGEIQAALSALGATTNGRPATDHAPAAPQSAAVPPGRPATPRAVLRCFEVALFAVASAALFIGSRTSYPTDAADARLTAAILLLPLVAAIVLDRRFVGITRGVTALVAAVFATITVIEVRGLGRAAIPLTLSAFGGGAVAIVLLGPHLLAAARRTLGRLGGMLGPRANRRALIATMLASFTGIASGALPWIELSVFNYRWDMIGTDMEQRNFGASVTGFETTLGLIVIGAIVLPWLVRVLVGRRFGCWLEPLLTVLAGLYITPLSIAVYAGVPLVSRAVLIPAVCGVALAISGFIRLAFALRPAAPETTLAAG